LRGIAHAAAIARGASIRYRRQPSSSHKLAIAKKIPVPVTAPDSGGVNRGDPSNSNCARTQYAQSSRDMIKSALSISPAHAPSTASSCIAISPQELFDCLARRAARARPGYVAIDSTNNPQLLPLGNEKMLQATPIRRVSF
jgi:hypothetical protein